MAVVTRTVGGAHYGIRSWLVQRISAVFMLAYTLLLLILLLSRPDLDHAGWRALFAPAWMRYATLLFALSLYWHAWIGMRDIFMDYLKPTAIRLGAQTGVALLLLLYALWTIDILWGLA